LIVINDLAAGVAWSFLPGADKEAIAAFAINSFLICDVFNSMPSSSTSFPGLHRAKYEIPPVKILLYPD